MRVGAYMAAVVLVCSLGGLVLALGLSWAYADLERDAEQFGSESALLRDWLRLEEDLSQWSVTSDLVYGSGHTYLVDGALQRSDSIRKTVLRIQSDPLSAAHDPTLQAILELVNANELRLQDVIAHSSQPDQSILSSYLADWDSESKEVFTRLLATHNQTEDKVEYMSQWTSLWRSRLFYISIFSVLGYVVLVAITWRWIVLTTIRPLNRLAQDADSSLQEGSPFHPLPAGPLEMRALSTSLEAFAGNLEEIVSQRTHDVHGLIGLRDALFDAVPFPVIHRDDDGRFLECNKAFEAFFGLDQEEMTGCPTSDLPGSFQELLESMPLSGSSVIAYESQINDVNETERVVLCSQTIASHAGDSAGIVNVLVDITFRVEATQRAQRLHELRKIETESVASILDHQEFSEVIERALAEIGRCLSACGTTFGLRAGEDYPSIVNDRQSWRLDLDSPDRIQLLEPFAKISTPIQAQLDAGEVVEFNSNRLEHSEFEEIKQVYKQGIRSLVLLPIFIEDALVGTLTIDSMNEQVWHEDELRAVMSILRGLGRSIERIRSEIQSIEYAQQQQELLQELDHRVKNNLATILSMADQTARVTDDINEFQASFSGRIEAMARAHELLAASKWAGVDLYEAIQIVVAASGGSGRMSVNGPRVMLDVSTATPATLVLNELATNACKYGSLSMDEGRVEINWQLLGNDLNLTWREIDGPPVQLPFSSGMGTQLIKGFIVYQLRGAVEFSCQDGDLICNLTIPTSDDPQGSRSRGVAI